MADHEVRKTPSQSSKADYHLRIVVSEAEVKKRDSRKQGIIAFSVYRSFAALLFLLVDNW